MRHRYFALLLTAAAVALAPLPVVAQSADVPRTPWGKPDLQGVWDFATLTPMERPPEFADRATLTEEDVANIVARSAQFTQFLSENGIGSSDTRTGTYDEFWFDFGSDVSADRRTALVVDPPNGRIPDLTPVARERQAARRAYLAEHPADSWEDRNLAERCLVGFNSGPPMAPSAYNNVFQLFQTEEHVVILNEMVHDARIVPLDGRDSLDANVRQWLGSSRGYWDGDTLVVETANFRDETNFRGVTRDVRLEERFTRADDDTLLYRFTVSDPRTFERPWTAEVPMSLSSGPTFEYACHEGNYGLEGILAGMRAEEREAAAAARD